MDVLYELPHLTFYRGRVALTAILKALGVGKGDSVVTQAFTCLAVPEGILASGATPLYVDVEEGGVNMCPEDLERRLTAETKAVIVQHTFGIPARLAPIRETLAKRGLPLIEDCCHTYASTYVNQVVGTFGVGAFYSFEWGKPIVVGIGGSAVLNDPSLRQKVESFRNQCEEPPWISTLKIQAQYFAFERLYRPSRYWKVRAMFQKLSKAGAAEGNYNPTEGVAKDFHLRMAEPLRKRLREKLKGAAGIADNARQIAAKYDSGIRSQALTKVVVPEGAAPVYARYPLLCQDKPRLLAIAEESKIEVADWYRTPVHPLDESDWKSVHFERDSCPRAEALSRQVVSLPVNQKVRNEDIEATLAFLHDS